MDAKLLGRIERYLERPECDLDNSFQRGLAAGLKAGALALYEALSSGSDLDTAYGVFIRTCDTWIGQQIDQELLSACAGG